MTPYAKIMVARKKGKDWKWANTILNDDGIPVLPTTFGRVEDATVYRSPYSALCAFKRGGTHMLFLMYDKNGKCFDRLWMKPTFRDVLSQVSQPHGSEEV